MEIRRLSATPSVAGFAGFAVEDLAWTAKLRVRFAGMLGIELPGAGARLNHRREPCLESGAAYCAFHHGCDVPLPDRLRRPSLSRERTLIMLSATDRPRPPRAVARRLLHTETDAPVSTAPDAALAKRTWLPRNPRMHSSRAHSRFTTAYSPSTLTPTRLRMIEPGFRPWPNVMIQTIPARRSTIRMQEVASTSSSLRSSAKTSETTPATAMAKALSLQMIDAVIESTEANADIVGLALEPEDAYALEREGKRAIYVGIENGYPVGSDPLEHRALLRQGRALHHACASRTTTSRIRPGFRRPGTRRRQRLW